MQTADLTYTKKIQFSYKLLLWIGAVSICMFFAGLTSAMLVTGKPNDLLAFSMPSAFLISTIIIVSSSVFYQLGYINLKSGKKSIHLSTNVIITFILGVGFAISQYIGWGQLVNQGIMLTGTNSTAFGSYFYVITLAHLIHLFGGLVSLSIVLYKSLKHQYSKENSIKVNISLMYWHFLGILWVYLYLFLYYLKLN